jgi:hypothetical protein
MSIESSPKGNNENLKKTEYFASLGMGNLEAMRLLKRYGLMRTSNEPKGREAWGMLEGQPRGFRNIAEHCLVVGAVADVFLGKFAEQGYLTLEERAMGVKAAIIHDLTKRKELEFTKGVSEKKTILLLPDEQERLKESFLQEFGISDKDRQALHLSRLAGGGFFDLDPAEVHPLESPQSIIEWTVALSDWMVAHTSVVSVEKRIEEIIKRGGYSDEYRWWHRKFYGEGGNTETKDDDTVTKEVFIKIYPILAKVEREFRDALHIPQEERVADFVQSEFNRRFSNEPDQGDEQ